MISASAVRHLGWNIRAIDVFPLSDGKPRRETWFLAVYDGDFNMDTSRTRWMLAPTAVAIVNRIRGTYRR